jgi:hypothetical protein
MICFRDPRKFRDPETNESKNHEDFVFPVHGRPLRAVEPLGQIH